MSRERGTVRPVGVALLGAAFMFTARRRCGSLMRSLGALGLLG